MLDDGASIPESETIVEYLEDAFPDPALMPKGAEARAKVRLIGRVTEIYVSNPLLSLFGQMNPATRDAAVVQRQTAAVQTGLSYLETFIGDGPYAYGDRFTLADCQVTPTLFFVEAFAGLFGWPDMLADHPRVRAYLANARQDPVLGKVLEEMANGMKAMQARNAQA